MQMTFRLTLDITISTTSFVMCDPITVHQYRSNILVPRDINSRIELEEVRRLDVQLMDLYRHNRPIFYTRIMREGEYIPYYNIITILYVKELVTSDGISDTIRLPLGLIREFSSCV